MKNGGFPKSPFCYTKYIYEGSIMEGVRINKFLSEAGVCSRREADRLVENGEVTIDGDVAVTGARVSEGQKVAVNGKIVSKE